MNRRSLFGRFSTPLSLRRAAERPEHHRTHLEPLEVRKVLATTVIVDNSWVESAPDGVLTYNELVTTDFVNFYNYGVNAFGQVPAATGSVDGHHWLTSNDSASVSIDTLYIYAAIQAVDDTGGTGIVSLAPGTFTESDIVVDKHVSIIGSGTGATLIRPEVASAKAEQEFPANSHSGIIIAASSVTIQDLHIDGNANSGVTGIMAYHQGITTLYENQGATAPGVGGTAYQTLRAGNLSPTILGQINSTNRGEPKLLIERVTVDNTWYHGISLAAPAGTNYHVTNEATETEEMMVLNATVTNVGDSAANRGVNHIGILLQNLAYDDETLIPGSNLDTGSPPILEAGMAFKDTVSNVGIGIATRTYGLVSWGNDNNARNEAPVVNNTVSNAVQEGYHLEDWDGEQFWNNRATFSNGNTAIGAHYIHAGGANFSNTYGTVASNGPLIGIKIEDTFRSGSSYNGTDGRNAEPAFLLQKIVGPGTDTAGSVGILADNSYGVNTRTNFGIGHSVSVSGFETGVLVKQSNPSTLATTALFDRGAVNGNKTGFSFGPSVSGGGVVVIGQFNTTDPVVDPGTTFGATFEVSSSDFANGLSNQEAKPTFWSFDVVSVSGADVNLSGDPSTEWSDGQAVEFIKQDVSGSAVPGGGSNESKYYMRIEGTTTVHLYDSKAHYDADTPLTFTNNGTGTTILNVHPNDPIVSEAVQPKPDVVRTGSLSLLSDSVFKPYVNGNNPSLAATHVLTDFTSAFSWTNTVNFDQINPWTAAFEDPAVLGVWSSSNAIQNGDGYLHVSGASEAGSVFNAGASTPIDVSQYAYLQIIAKRTAGGNNTPNFLFALSDQDGTNDLYFVPTSDFTTSGFSTLLINLQAAPVRFGDGDDIMNWGAITGFAVSGDFGYTDGTLSKFINLDVDSISFTKGPDSSSFDVTGTVSLNGATLAPTIGNLFSYSTVGQTFKILNNDGTDAVSGTFMGLTPAGTYASIAEGGTVTNQTGGTHFTISYAAGTNSNDVVLTKIANSAPQVDLDSDPPSGSTSFNSVWSNAGPISITDTDASTADSDDATLSSLTATIDSPDANDVLAATATLTGVGISGGNLTQSFNSGTGVLTISGQALKSVYTTILKSLTYDNTGGGTGADRVVHIKVNDGASDSNIADANIHDSTVGGGTPSLIAGTGHEGRYIFYNHSKFDGNSDTNNASDDNAIPDNKTVYLPGDGQMVLANITNFSRGLNGIMVDLTAGSADHTLINASDFVFKVGANNSPDLWATLTATPTISVRTGAGISGSDRVDITWNNNAIQNQYLEVQVLATSHTGMDATFGTISGNAVGDVFFFGNLIGETNSVTPGGAFARSLSADGNPIVAAGVLTSVGIDSFLDVDRSNSVTFSGDRNPIVVGGVGTLIRISIGTAGPFAPEGGSGGGDAGISSGLAATSGSSSSSSSTLALPASVATRLDSAGSTVGVVGTYSQLLDDAGAAAAEDADDAGLDDETLDSIVEGL